MQEQEHLLSRQEGAKKASERLQKNLSDKLKAQGLKLPLYPTPQIIERARSVMGGIDFDPTSDPVQQVLVNATSVPSLEVNPLQEHWHGNVWVSPKGAVRNSRIWFNKTVNEYRNGHIKRIKQLKATSDGFEPVCPSTWNFIVYGPPAEDVISDIDKVTLFYNSFRDIGRVIFNEFAGDSWAKDLSFYEQHKGDV